MESQNFKDEAQKQEFYRILRAFLTLVVFFSLAVFAFATFFNFGNRTNYHIKCDAEQIDLWEKRKTFIQDGRHFTGGNFQDSNYAFEGKHSMVLVKDSFGMEFHLKYLKGNEKVNIYVWRYAEGDWINQGHYVAEIPGLMYKITENVINKREDGWEQIHMEFTVPKGSQNSYLKCFAFNPDLRKVYFDNLDIWVQEEELMFGK